jgi:tryptophan-rich hypothetical protein
MINPAKLLHSKWTWLNPVNKERHFMVTKVKYDEDGAVTLCVLEAIIDHREYTIDWRSLNDTAKWEMGWK